MTNLQLCDGCCLKKAGKWYRKNKMKVWTMNRPIQITNLGNWNHWPILTCVLLWCCWCYLCCCCCCCFCCCCYCFLITTSTSTSTTLLIFPSCSIFMLRTVHDTVTNLQENFPRSVNCMKLPSQYFSFIPVSFLRTQRGLPSQMKPGIDPTNW